MSTTSVPQHLSIPVALVFALASGLCSPLAGASGDLLWEQTETPGLSCLDPVATGKRVFTHITESTDKNRPYPVMRAYDLATGERLWESRDRIGYTTFGFILNSVAAARGRVFSVANRAKWRTAVTVTARDAVSGAFLWRRDFGDSLIQYEVLDISASDEGVFLVGRREYDPGPNDHAVWTEVMVVALDSRNGLTLWEDYVNLAGGPDIGTKVSVDKGRLVVGILDWPPGLSTPSKRPNGVVRTYSAADGRVMWQHSMKNASVGDIAINRGRVFALLFSRELQSLASYALGTGEVHWKRRVHKSFASSISAARRMIAVYGARTPIARTSMRIQVYDGKSGRLMWRRNEEGEDGQILAARGRLFTLRLPDGPRFLLNAYWLRTGRPRWSFPGGLPETEEYACGAIAHKGVVVTTSFASRGEIVRVFKQ